MTELEKQWKELCNQYARTFAEKHGIDISYEIVHDLLWVGNNPGTVCEMADMYIGMEEIRYDIDNNIPEGQFEKWYWKNLDIYELTGTNYMNYESFCKGCPDIYTEEKLQKIREGYKRVDEAEKDLERLINEFKNEKSR